jgi:hypothetical protein
MLCCVCNRARQDGHTLTLSESEKATIFRLTTVKAPDSYFYCGPCWKVCTDKVQGVQLFKGLLQENLKRAGVRGASDLASRYAQVLTKKPTS